MKNKTIIIVIIILVVVFCVIYLYYENNKLIVSNYNVINKNIPIDFNDFKIVHITDFHNTNSKVLTEDLIKEIEKQKPNIIVITGDLIDANKLKIEVAVDFIKNINIIAPVYFVPGNHEGSLKDYDLFKKKLLENEVIVLDNKTEVLKINDKEINLIGVIDPYMIHENVEDSEIINVQLDNNNYNENNFSILLSHRPELFLDYVERKLDLVLAGHAHGGQIRLPFIGGLYAPNQGIFPKYTSGMFEKEETTMIVSRGIGNSTFPFRINNRPELVVITLNNE